MDTDKEKSEFYTLKGYRMMSDVPLTESLEDYIEMICRISNKEGYARINDLARMLNVAPSSASKMVNKLRELGFVIFPKYGIILLTERGNEIGAYLIWRHKTLERFLRLVNGEDNVTKTVEQIEHYIDEKTAKNIEKVSDFLESNAWTKWGL